MRWTLMILMALAMVASAATRDHLIRWIPPTETVDGDPLDADGDGVAELLDGFRLYTETGQLVQDFPDGQLTEATIRYNFNWGTTCFKMTAYNSTGESDYSNVGACKLVEPGRPKPPRVED